MLSQLVLAGQRSGSLSTWSHSNLYVLANQLFSTDSLGVHRGMNDVEPSNVQRHLDDAHSHDGIKSPTWTNTSLLHKHHLGLLFGFGCTSSMQKSHMSLRSFAVTRSLSTSQQNPHQQTKGHIQDSNTSTSDSGFLMRVLPASLVPYAQLMRLDKPIGTWLLLWPSLWSISLAAPAGQLPDPFVTALFAMGAVLLRGSGCTINDLWDRDLDKQVERTRRRPLASGAVQPAQAIGFLAAQLSVGLMILLQLNTYTQVLGVCALPLIATYPLMKRITNWPQAYLGLAMNWGVFMGWSAIKGSCDWSVLLPMYTAGVCWTLIYDTIYAHQDKADDVKVGIKSTALHFGTRTKPVLELLTGLQVCGLTLSGVFAGVSPAFYLGVAAMGAHLAIQIKAVDLNNPASCQRTFVSNKVAGGLFFAGCVAGRYLL